MISPQAYIAPGAQIGARVRVYPFAYIEDDVVIGDDCVIYPHVSLMSGTRLGQGNTIYQNAVLGASPQDFSWQGGASSLVIGDHNVIRENVVISRSSLPTVSTQIGDHNILMEGTHISHNCVIGDHNVFGYAVKIACDCTIGSKTIFSSNVTAKPQCHIGDLAFILTGCRFGEDIPPYITVKDNPATYAGIHAGMLAKVGGIDERTQRLLAMAYRLVFKGKVSLYDAILQIEEQVPDGPEIRQVIAFLRASHGIISK